ncbi:hypothetical protein FGE12_05175 [Aggregicoccus sp. 17bor-14]|uniref:hypothetical protein n=1 Tax=Myxococcaceae TaxID=31 RepID=UPI00129C61E1|nr:MULTISPECIES: hypothetical protein [Myxococcaceae]MBF5041773.1 hypothetical protein [Simulacricoccus sp. 17bor-14]MRI87554.1 hypothetical protein [Aggregicoccus sp. 17bor-14]
MIQKFRLLAAITVLGVVAACATKPKGQASSTIEEIPNEPGANGAPAEGAAPPAGTQLVELAAPEGFKVQMPANPQVNHNKTPTAAGEVTVGSWSTQTDGVVYSVSTADYPESVIASISPAAFLNGVRDGVVKQLKGGTLKSEEEVTLDGYPGKSFVAESNQGEAKVRTYLVGPRLYTLVTVYNPSVGAPQADTFLGSLQLVNPPPAIPFRGKGAAGADAGTADGAAMDADAGTAAPDAGTPAPAPKKRRH